MMIPGKLTKFFYSLSEVIFRFRPKSILLFPVFLIICLKIEAQSFKIVNLEKSVILRGELINNINTEQVYFLIPQALHNKKSKTATKYISQGTTAFYFINNGLSKIQLSDPKDETTLNSNGAIEIQLNDLTQPNLIEYSLLKEPFNGIYGQLELGYMANGLLPFNSEEQMLLPYSQKSDFNLLVPEHDDWQNIFRIDGQSIIFGNEFLKITPADRLTFLSARNIPQSRIDFLSGLYVETIQSWATQFRLSAPERFNVILDHNADVVSPFIKNTIVLHFNISNAELIFQLLTTLAKSMILATNPKISESDLEATTLALILHVYENTDSEKIKTALYTTIFDLQIKYNEGLFPSFTDPLMDKDKRLLTALKKLSDQTHDQITRSEFILANIEHQEYINDRKSHRKDKYKINIASEYPGNLWKRYLMGAIDPQYPKLIAIPLMGYNRYDGLMIGGGLRWRKNINLDIVPFGGLNSKRIAGIADISKKIFPENSSYFRMIKPYISLQRFSYDENITRDGTLLYSRITLGTKFHLLSERNKFSSYSEYFNLQFNRIDEEPFNIQTPAGETKPFNIFRLSYHVQDSRAISPRSFYTRLETANYTNYNGNQKYIKLECAYEESFAYRSGKYIALRIYGGFFPYNTQENSASVNNIFTRGSLSLFNRGFSDYGYDHLLIDRSNSGFFSQQIFKGNGGFKVPATSLFGYGQSNKMLFSSNLTFDFPFTHRYFPVKSYLDIAYVKDNTPIGPIGNDEFYASGGIYLEWKKKLAVYFPLFHSKQIKYIVYEADIEGQTIRNYLKRISFVIDFSHIFNLND